MFSKLGSSANVEQQILPGIGFVARGGHTPGKLEAYAFTDVDMTLAGGLSLSGKHWGRPSDNFGIAAIRNAISWSHQAYLNAGRLYCAHWRWDASSSGHREDPGSLLHATDSFLDVDVGLSVHCKSGLQSGPRPSVNHSVEVAAQF